MSLISDPENSIVKINAHGHLLPYPEEIPVSMRQKEIFWVSDDRKFMCQGKWRRPITDDSFFLNEKLEWMDRNAISKEVILNLSQLYCNGLNVYDTRDVIRFQNDFNLSLQKRFPDRFIGGFVIQPLYIDDALKEIERCVNAGMKILCLPTHFISGDGLWSETPCEAVLPVFELANYYNLAVEFHPYNAEQFIQLKDNFWRFHLIWLCAQTADCFHFFSSLNFAEKFSDARFCFAHGNQFGQMGYGRRKQGFTGRPDLFTGATDPEENIRCENVYFDTLVHDVLSFELLVKRQGTDNIVAGLDDPYPLGEMESVPGSYPGKVLDEALKTGCLDLSAYRQIWYDNVLRWVG